MGKTILIILDGWGIAEPSSGNAVYSAKTPTIDFIENTYFSASLQASGIAAGLPWGREGNSEVGHMNIGAGRIIYQYLPRIVSAIRDGSFFENKALLNTADFIKRNNSTLHIMGLVSSGTVHAYIDNLYALIEFAKRNDIKKVVIHIFTDGKDAEPAEGANFIKTLQDRLQTEKVAKIGTLIGRAYAMDRNNKWELTQKTYDLLTQGIGEKINDPVEYLRNSYKNGKTDFDIEPAVVYENEMPVGLIKENDALIFTHFREDSARQLTKAFVATEGEFHEFERKKIPNLYFVSMTKYEDLLPVEVLFSPPIIKLPLAEILAKNNKTQLHIAETEKYAHVTYFFNGENEKRYEGEERVVVPSIGTPHYNKNPEMQAYNISQKLYENIDKYDFFLINFANADMLAHTGDFKATILGIETIDANLARILDVIKDKDIELFITSDHGHAENMLNLKTGEVSLSHTINPVPFYAVGKNFKSRHNLIPLYQRKPVGILADVAPTILKSMEIQVPPEMTGKPLV
ncbi:MAG: phosphoglycerate mutase (2,3-diphosphoglycerate-independent) [Candidatus Spechtbacteria bacterium RIFCSPLOWO2_02_FULL_38_8]|uniref:2,3-bisphosphoglycerate-independent phosphoglycerate mutase n=1 Tax=Candidatus Spechtbacteria bacterium RIFCSPLOWO2_02_FULL_38_8 TaxID=1802164 RepID=A0A1G2HFK0_9BACT|nr:MAG: phosphoglycerate mutase (2,3-diphosphoglycerate-independent) [Candidatus Spechtbacteria bacterium RIFCSPLOWO2_02_FULL_38_8]